MSLGRSHRSVREQGAKVAKELIADTQTKAIGATYQQKLYEIEQLYLAALLVRANYSS